MYFLDKYGEQKLSLIKKGRSQREQKHYIKRGVVDNQVILFCGSTRSGKSVFANAFANELHELPFHKIKKGNKYRTVIYITEKEGQELANAFHIFNPDELYHINLLKEQKQSVKTKPCKIYHPFTFNFPYKKRLPEMKLFGFKLSDTSKSGFSSIIASDSAITIDACIEIRESLSEEDDIYTFLWHLNESIKESKNDFSLKPEDMFLPPEISGDKRTVKGVKTAFKGFREDYFLHNSKSSHLIDFVDLCNDYKNIHHFTTKFISSKKRKVFAIIEILDKINQAIKSGMVNTNLVLVLEELKILTPSGSLKPEQQEFLNVIYDLLSRIGSQAYVIATAQSFFDINWKARGLFNKIFLGRLSPNDRKILIKDFQFNRTDQIKLNTLQVGEFVLWETQDEESQQLSDKIAVDVPPFCNHEEGENFFNKFSKTFPDKLVTHTDIYKDIKSMRINAENKRKLEMKAFIKQKKIKEQAKKLASSGKVDEAKQKIKKLSDEKKDIIQKQVYDMKIEHPDWSWRKIARKIKEVKSHSTAKKYYSEYKNKVTPDNLPDLNKENPNKQF